MNYRLSLPNHIEKSREDYTCTYKVLYYIDIPN